MMRWIGLWFAALLLAVLPGQSARADQPGPQAGAGMFNPPPSPMLLTRELRRSLSDGKEVISRRSYAVRFTPEAGGGYRVDGRLVFPGRGGLGHGYDPIFVPEGSALTYGEMGDAAKNTVSHRGRAFAALKEALF